MTFDGRYKMVMYHRENGLGELFDLETDPGEFGNLWNDPGLTEFKLRRMQDHVDTVMATVSAGEPRVATY